MGRLEVVSIVLSAPLGILNHRAISQRGISFTIRTFAAYLVAFYPWTGDFSVYCLRSYDSPDYGGHVKQAYSSGNMGSLHITHVSDKTFNISGLDVCFFVIDLFGIGEEM